MRNTNRKRLALLLIMVVVLGVSSNDIYLSSLPQIAENFGVDADWANLTLSIFNVGMAIGCLFVGFISDCYGRRKIYLGALFTYMLLATAIVLTPWLKLIIVWHFFQGATVAVFAVVSLQIIADVCDSKERVRYTGLVATGAVLSPAVAPVLGAYIAHYSSWEMCFAFSAVFAALLLLFGWKYLPETVECKVAMPKVSSLVFEYAVYFKSLQFIGFSLLIMFFYGAYFSFISMSSYIYIDELGVDPRWYAKIFLLLAVAYLFGNTAMQKLHSRGTSKRRIVTYGLFISVIGTLSSFAVYASHKVLVITAIISLSVVLLRAGYALLLSPAQILVMEAGKWREGTAVGLLYFMQFVFGALASAVVSCFHETPLYATIWITAVLMLFSLISFIIGCVGKVKYAKKQVS